MARHTRRRFLKIGGAAGAVGLTGLAGCTGGSGNGGGSGGTTEGGSTPTPTSTSTGGGGGGSESVTFGAIHPITGPYGALAQFQKQGVDLAVKSINDAGMLDGKATAVHMDSQLDPQTGRQAAKQLVEEQGVDVLIGCISSSVGEVVADYAASQNVPYMCGTAANTITMDNCKRTTFRYEMRAQQTGVATTPWAVSNFGTNVWIHNADYAWGNSVGKAWSEQAQAASSDVKILGHTKSDLGATDFSSYISQISASDADWVATGLNGGDAVNFLKQASSYGLKGTVDIVSPTNAFQFIRKAAASAATGTYATIRYFEKFDSQANKDFASQFRDAYGNPPDNFAHVEWVDAHMYAKAVAQAGSTKPGDVIPALEQVEYDGPMGKVSYRACDHQAARPVNLGKITPPEEYDWPSIQVMETVSAQDAITPCEQTGCSF